MAVGDVMGTDPGPWWFDMDGSGTKSRRFATKTAAEEAGKAFKTEYERGPAARQAAIDAENAAKAADGLDASVLAAAYAQRTGQGR
ncbi:hypothetical protein QE385_003249 [Sphingomonas sp. SORGH_AS 950]|uniref:hypothetical protein n=1 Tax=Sphingomonas sp. SORGH_AS_0950 TaxID=3041792 RepID=UPI002789837B|nr:hypothetical protein [Sphingomonas sp. SORGH_AS_0950]MDQ1158922.1 hypothetical protein [Sphingomonas sp. SORGH_AS_0950]